MQEKRYKNCKIVKLIPGLEISCLFENNFVLILFNMKVDGNWKISANVIQFFSFAGPLPVIFRIFRPSSSFFKPLKNGHDRSQLKPCPVLFNW